MPLYRVMFQVAALYDAYVEADSSEEASEKIALLDVTEAAEAGTKYDGPSIVNVETLYEVPWEGMFHHRYAEGAYNDEEEVAI
jgi:hypothetical protein